MSYVNELLQIYDRNQDKIGVIEYRGDTPYTLLPPFHTTVTAQITVTIDQNGTFMRAERVEANDKMTGAVPQGKSLIRCVIIFDIWQVTIRNIIRMMEAVFRCISSSYRSGSNRNSVMKK